MNISINPQLNFKSKANPISPFLIKTKKGRLTAAEVTKKDLKNGDFIKNLTTFFCKNFASQTEDPAWKIFADKNRLNYDSELKRFIQYYTSRIRSEDEDMTLLLAKDKRNKIQAACFAFGYDGIPAAKDYACYVDSIAINKQYRGLGIGNILFKKITASAKNRFTDMFLMGDRKAAKFYEKLGFKPLDKNCDSQKKIIDYISGRRFDYPEYIELYTKPLKENAERWYENCARYISTLNI